MILFIPITPYSLGFTVVGVTQLGVAFTTYPAWQTAASSRSRDANDFRRPPRIRATLSIPFLPTTPKREPGGRPSFHILRLRFQISFHDVDHRCGVAG